MIKLYILFRFWRTARLRGHSLLSTMRLWFKIRAWLQHDPRMAHHAQREWIKQQSHLHPAEKGDHWR